MTLATTAPRHCRDDLETLARQAGRDLEEASAAEIVRWAADTFGDRFAVTSSMQDTALSHLVSQQVPGVDVVFLDTGYHFPETLGTADAASVTIPINLVTVRPRQTVAEQDATLGPDLYRRNPELCCQLRKVAPLERALTNYDAWATGIRRDESPTRANTPVVSWDARRGKVKIAPLARWTQEDVDRYIADNGVLTNPLLDDGYPSVGCWPCTRKVAEGEDARAGRWSGRAKTECGIHR
ncbi:phosphoadenylyl-sulfate reductase [Actinopolymorpha rutila]|uniref:Adenosine 5'-phosphosulfate reductase n=1 Tax=Actinopolymorpha rutila TaxID=446787 RepID=A0A852ZBU4_9ACTN|nr:phosphoadenylyl-sulfate reductase [Actinopolymorpha rutila]NYH90627.1 phosphoadenosine phosphosulfate reductase [Actinopolymorpha rutila]